MNDRRPRPEPREPPDGSPRAHRHALLDDGPPTLHRSFTSAPRAPPTVRHVLDDPAATVRDLPGLRAYDRGDIEVFLTTAERREAELRIELHDARSRRAIAELSDAADAAARQILLDAERDALAARESLRDLLEQLDAPTAHPTESPVDPPVTEV